MSKKGVGKKSNMSLFMSERDNPNKEVSDEDTVKEISYVKPELPRTEVTQEKMKVVPLKKKLLKAWHFIARGCKKKQKSQFLVKREKEKEKTREQIEDAYKIESKKQIKIRKVKRDGLNDSWFKGDEYKHIEQLNPNVDMKFHQFYFDPEPDFTVQYAMKNI